MNCSSSYASRFSKSSKFISAALNKLADQGRKLGADYRVRVRIFTDQKEEATIVPRSAVFRSATGNWQAFVVVEDRVKLVPIQLGLQNDFEVEVLSGIQPGDWVVVAPESDLAHESKIEWSAAGAEES